MEKNLPIYQLEISDEKDGVFAISVVEHPAIESDFMLFSKEKEQVQFTTNNEQRIITGPALIPDKLIYRRTEDGYEYNITIPKEVIKQTAIKFFKDNAQNNTTLEHREDVEGTTYFESWIIEDNDNDKSNFLGFSDLPIGTWMVSLKVHDEQLWNKIKEGHFNGFSIEGYFDKVLVKQQKQNNNAMSNLIDKIKSFLSSLESEEVTFKDAKLEDGTIIRIDEETMDVLVINEDGSLTPLADGDYILEDGSKFTVKDGKKGELEAPAEEEAPVEESVEEDVTEEEAPVEAEMVDLVLADGTIVEVDTDTRDIKNKETGELLEDGHYVLESGEEFDVVDGKIVIEQPQEEAPVEQTELAKIKLGLVKKDRTEELLAKIEELNAKIEELEAKPAVEKTAPYEVKESDMSYAERIAYNIKKDKGLV